MQSKFIIIDALETARKTQGLTQAELASRAGTSRVTVGRIEAGFDPRLSTVYELARALGLELTLVPKSLADEVQSFLRSGGRSLAQPVGASAPPSVVDLAAVVTPRPSLKADLATVARQVAQPSQRTATQKAHDATAGQGLLPASGQASRVVETSGGSVSAKPRSLSKRTGKPMISTSAAMALGLSPQPKTDKNTKGGT